VKLDQSEQYTGNVAVHVRLIETALMQVRIRDDKDPEQATSAEQVADMYRAQAVHTSKNRAKEADED
jgi:hypothetical protein